MKDLEKLGIESYNNAFENGKHESFFHYTDEKIYAAGFMDGYSKAFNDVENLGINIRYVKDVINVVCKDADDYWNYISANYSNYSEQISNIYRQCFNIKTIIFVNDIIVVGMIETLPFYYFNIHPVNTVFTENAKDNPHYDLIIDMLYKGYRC